MSRLVPTLFLLSLAAAPLHAQAPAPAASGNAAVLAVRNQWESTANYIVQSARDMPEAKFSYRPTPEVRSFGEIIGHVAGAQRMICAVALGEQPPAEDAVERSITTKAGLIEALEAANAYCGRAYAMSDADGQKAAELFGQKTTRFGALVLNATHDAEHYGNLVTYLRINGIVPPSSRGGM
jgi:uncharacterized damage-inducible protein DinB